MHFVSELCLVVYKGIDFELTFEPDDGHTGLKHVVQ
jgi:hypothetical protein